MEISDLLSLHGKSVRKWNNLVYVHLDYIQSALEDQGLFQLAINLEITFIWRLIEPISFYDF